MESKVRPARSLVRSNFSFAKLIALLASVFLTFSGAAHAAVPKGVFSLSPAGVTARESVLDNPNVDGISLRQDWSDLEPTEGSYNWSFLDSEVARAGAAGKPVLLRINTQAAKPAWVTAAVSQAGGSFFTFDQDGVQTTIPVFWDPTFLAKKKAMIAAVGAHFTSNSAIKIVCVSFANANSEDWSVPHTSSDISAWEALGYTSEKMLEAGQQIIDSAMAAFPNQYLTLAVGGNGNLDPDVNYVARNTVLSARASWPGRLIVQKNSLATYNPPAPGTGTVYQLLWDSRPDIGGQMLFNCFSDTSYRMNNGVAGDPANILHESVNDGFAYGMNYIEIYQVDVLNLSAEIAYAHQVLLGLAPPSDTTPPLNVPKAPSGLRDTP